jgi:hypothetical protein
MEDLKEMLQVQQEEITNHRIMSFDDLYARRQQAIALEMEPRSSYMDPMSPRETDSMTSFTPKGAIGERGPRGSFFREQPTSTTNMNAQNRQSMKTDRN